MGEEPASSPTDTFIRHRPLLFTVAYEMLGSVVDSEDVLQEVWLRWDAADRSDVLDPRAYLVRITTRLALNRLRTLARRREDYVGTWLPEPFLTTPDVADDVTLADSVSTAVQLVLLTLTDIERAVFVLREVFALPYAEIAAAIDRTPEATRQIAHRARSHVQARRPRGQVDSAEQHRVVEVFRTATATGDLQQLMDVLAPDVVLLSDGGGAVSAALRPIHGVEKVLRFLTGVYRADLAVERALVGGSPAMVIRLGGRVDSVATALVEGGVVTAIYVVRNPAKLSHVSQEVPLTRGLSAT